MIETDRELAQLAAEAPDIPGLGFRRLRLPADLVALAEMHNRATEADGIDERESAEEWEAWFRHPSGFDPLTDCLVGEVGSRIVAYGQARAEDDNDGGRDYISGGEVDPDYRGRGIGRAVLRHNIRHQQARAKREAALNPADPPREQRLESWAFETQTRRTRLLTSEGFEVVRWFFEMLRPNLDDIAELPMPEGLDIRPVVEADHRQIFDADVEAFRDHWGGMAEGEEAFARFFGPPDFRPELWRVAWDGDQVAGVVMNRVMTTFNEQTGELRGLLAGVSVRRPWRRRGLARALVAESLRAFRDAGMTSAVLGVDAENPTGALSVYEANGFAVHRKGMNFRRQLDLLDVRP
ncbi:MAG TPA: GNAT family N-acetyltransferase [Candidatus Limnocylindria bacterium]|nr:GNAT family N-acetyltransferase [Candidatus Limnocylindria bacterium]